MPDRIVAVGLLTQRDVDVLGQGFRRAFPVDDLADFQSLLRAIDKADRRDGDVGRSVFPSPESEPYDDR